MSMSKIRKSIQAKLRRKFKWSTNTDYNRGVMFEKLDVNPYYVKRSDFKKNSGHYDLLRLRIQKKWYDTNWSY